MKNPSIPFVLPFVAFLGFLALDGKLGLPPAVEYPVRVLALSLILWFVSREAIDLRIRHWVQSIAIGILVFAIWIAPESLVPGYRQHWLFQNPIVGAAPAPDGGYAGIGVIAIVFRVLRAVLLVPIIEELFWRAWLMRWLINPAFLSVPLGAFAFQSFAITAALFGLEHGAYWEVGLIAGIIYNWWMVRTRSLGDCILAHSVTNACLSAYVLSTGNWQYW